MLSYMKCGMAGCEKARKVSTNYCPEHEPTDTFEHWLERTGQNTKNIGAVALAKSAWNAALAQPVSGLQRTAGDVLRQFRESGSEDWGELESAINWWAMNEFCPNFTKGDRAVSEGRLRELAVKWRKGPWHTYTESIPEAYKEGVLDCADELERALESA